MSRYFIDTGFWIGLLDQRDGLHGIVLAYQRKLSEASFVTTQMVLTELFASFSSKAPLRQEAVDLCDALYKDEDIVVVPNSEELFFDALNLYRARLAKTWSLVDCASFIVMDALEIDDALTHDIHFEQAGFSALLRRDPA